MFLNRFIIFSKKYFQCLRSISKTEELIDKINNNVRKFDRAMKLTQTCLNERERRESVENCRDIPQMGLKH